MKKLLCILLALTVLLSLGASAFAGNDETPDGRWLCSFYLHLPMSCSTIESKEGE